MKLTSEQQAKTRIRELIKQIKEDNLQLKDAPPYEGTTHIVTEFLKIQVKEGKHPFGDGDGYYISNPNPTILIDPEVKVQERLNFTFYHEVTHHLIKQDNELYSFIHEYGFHGFDQTLEHYCNIGAAEFLVPLEKIQEHIKQKGFGIQLIYEFDNICSASKPALAIQLAQAANHKCIVVVCEYGFLQNQNQSQTGMDCEEKKLQLFVQYASSSPSCKYSCSRFVPIPRNHLIYAAYLNQQYVVGRDKTIFKSGNNWTVDCEAFFYRGKVFAVFNLSMPVPTNQMSFDFY
jgi:Zn-dependent peptidase ImmA (M78 family)